MSAPAEDVLRQFSAALTPAARHHLELNYQTIALVHAATERVPPLELARICSVGIGWNHPANAAGLIRYRLKREAGTDHDDQEN